MPQSAQINHRASEKKFLAWTALLVMALGVPVFYSFISKNEVPLVSSPPLTPEQDKRTPASFQQISTTAETSRNNSFAVPCLESTKGERTLSFQTVKQSVLLTGGDCFQNNSDLKVQNTTNGFTAEVIFQPQKGFSTDFVPLNAGPNRIVLKPRLGEPLIINIQRMAQ